MKATRLFSLLFVFLVLVSCEDALECALGIRPEINETAITTAFVDEVYEQRITAEVNNTANDNAYNYFFEVYGDLPAGIDVLFLAREIRIVGTPLEAGNFDFTVFLWVERFENGFYDTSPTCGDEVSTNFTLVVNE